MNTPCIKWTGYIRPISGYGQACFKRPDGTWSQRNAHRVVYEAAHGPLKPGLIVMLRCDNRVCVNIEHLEVGTHKDNMEDMVRKGRSASGERNSKAKLTVADVAMIKCLLREGFNHHEIARRFGVQPPVIWKIAHGRLWKDVEAAS